MTFELNAIKYAAQLLEQKLNDRISTNDPNGVEEIEQTLKTLKKFHASQEFNYQLEYARMLKQ